MTPITTLHSGTWCPSLASGLGFQPSLLRVCEMGSGEVSTPGEGSRTAWLCLEPHGPDRAQRCDVCAEAALEGGGFGSSCRFGLDPTIRG